MRFECLGFFDYLVEACCSGGFLVRSRLHPGPRTARFAVRSSCLAGARRFLWGRARCNHADHRRLHLGWNGIRHLSLRWRAVRAVVFPGRQAILAKTDFGAPGRPRWQPLDWHGGGLAHFADGKLFVYPDFHDDVGFGSLLQDRAGNIWFGRSEARGALRTPICEALPQLTAKHA